MATLHLKHSVNRSFLGRGLLLIPLVLVCFGLSPAARAVSPAPDGGYPGFNTAEGEFSLQSLTGGSSNTAIGFQALFKNTSGNNNTSIGVNSLFSNIAGGDNNTAAGNSALQSNTTGTNNTATGNVALLNNMTGSFNTAIGGGALFGNTTGANNTAAGQGALRNSNGDTNTAFGQVALFTNTDGFSNTAVGEAALQFNSHGSENTAVGLGALIITTGSDNTALGLFAGENLTSGSNNTYIGANSGGAGNESGWIRIGDTGASIGVSTSKTAIGGIYDKVVAGTLADPTEGVVCNASGQLGTVASSVRFKKDIDPMGKTSEVIFSLKPVTFHYKGDETNLPCFGLIAEEVAKVSPALIVPDKEGKPFSVRYEQINAMLLNEFLKEHRQVAELKKDFKATVAQQQKEIQALTARLKEQAAQIQKVSAQLEMSKPAPQVVNNNP